jgi:hypothetical protein
VEGEACASGRPLKCGNGPSVLGSITCRKGHFVTPPAPLLPKIPIGVDVFVAEPSVLIFVLEVFQWTGCHVAAKIRIILYLYLLHIFHDALLL